MIANRYTLLEPLGSGTSGTVYRARDVQLGRDVAIKILHASIAAREDALARFMREARVSARFHHPGAVEVYEVGESSEGPFLVMELLTGVALDVALGAATSPTSLSSICAIGAALAEVLAAAHLFGIVHRDVKPANIFISGTLATPGRVRLVDFGLAFLLTPPSASLGRITVEGDLLGTPAYMSPEQCEAHEVGPPSDVYAIGCLLYELVTGYPPFVGNLARIIAGHVYLPPIPIGERDLARPVPYELGALIGQMLDKDPERRPTAAELAVQLPALADGSRSTRGTEGSRSERAIPAAEFAPTATETSFTVGLLHNDATLAKALIEQGFTVSSTENADVLIVALDDLGAPTVPWFPSRSVVLGVHAAPTPTMLATSIRAGVVTVARWPGDATKLATRVRSLRRPKR